MSPDLERDSASHDRIRKWKPSAVGIDIPGRKSHGKGGSLAFFAFNFHRATVHFDDVFYDRQSQSQSAMWPGDGVVCLSKPIEDIG